MIQTSPKTNPKFPVDQYQPADQQPGSVAERKHLEQQLAYQTLILDHIQDAVIAFDKDLTITSWNRGAEKLYGYPAEEALGQFIFDLLRTELTVDELKNAIETLAEAGQFSAEFVQYTKNGDRICIEANTITMQDHTG